MTKTTCLRESLDWEFNPRPSPQSAQERSGEIPSDETSTPASTTCDSHDSIVRASLPQTAPSSNAPLNERFSQGVLELISLHQITLDDCHPIDPASYITELEAFGEAHFARRYVVQIEHFFGLPQRYGLALEERIQDVKRRCDFLECPQHERPNGCPLDTRDCICEVERYVTTKINYAAWPGEHVQSYTVVCLSQLFGRLHYTPPTNMCPDEIPSASALLISLHEERRMQYGIGSFTPTISLKLRNPDFLEVLGPYYQLQKEKDEVLATYVDWQHIQKYGGNSYIQNLRLHYTWKHDTNPRLEDVELRDYKELASMFQGRPAANKTVPQLIGVCREFPKAWTDLKDWSEEETPTLAWLYAVQLLAILGFKVSMKDFLRDPRRVLDIIYGTLQWESPENDQECSPGTPSSFTYSGDADELPLLCPDTESLSDGEDDTTLNNDADTNNYVNADDCYGFVESFNDNYRHLLLRLFGLWVRIQELKVEQGRIRRAERVLCAWRTFANLVLSSGLDGAILTIELQLPWDPSSKATALDRVCCCERQLGMESFSLLQPRLPDPWKPLTEAVELLSNIPRYELKHNEISKVLGDHTAVRVYLAACVAKLGYVLPEDGLYRGREISNKVWYKVFD